MNCKKQKPREANLLGMGMPEESDTPTICPTCGSQIPAAAPDELCPSCVLRESQQRSSAADAPDVEAIAAAFPDLEVERLLGRGGMGAVYLARQPKLNREIALKVLLPDAASDPAFAERFNREARALAQLNHPNIVSLYEFGEQGGFYFLAMEFVDGVNLRQAMDAGRFTPHQALEVIPGICNALEAAHAQGILHRDIKPENILLDRDGEVKIVDFGIARIVGDSASDFTLTEIGAVLGSRQYMAPEQVEQAHEIDHRADIYSLGVVFYEMLTGELPIGRFLPPSMKSSANETIDQIVLRTLEKELDRRFQTVTQVKTEVQAADSTPSAPAGNRIGSVLGSIPRFTFWTITLFVAGGLFAGVFGILADGLGEVVIIPIVIGLIAATLGYAGCWLALSAIHRKDIAAIGKGWLQFFAILVPLVMGGWAAALGSAEAFILPDKGCIFLTILFTSIPMCLVILAVKAKAGVELGAVSRRRIGGAVAVLTFALLGFAYLKDGHWPYDHLLRQGVLTFGPFETDEDVGKIRSAIKPAFGKHEERYKVWFDEPKRTIHIQVLISKRSQIEATKHIQAYAQRLLDLLPAKLVEESYQGIAPREYNIVYGPLFLTGLLSALAGAGAGAGLLGGRTTKFGLPVLFVLSSVLWVLPSGSDSFNGVPLIDAPPLPPFELPDYEPDFSTAESAAATLMEASIRGDTEVLRRAFSKDWSEEAFRIRSRELMKSYNENVRVLGLKKGRITANEVQITVEVVRRDGGGTGRYGTAFGLEDGEWKVTVPR
ncbi:MAG: tRNA A-37 threonylcarbamoyl transferase component Bud32 [Verrucomicrobiales bacterium]